MLMVGGMKPDDLKGSVPMQTVVRFYHITTGEFHIEIRTHTKGPESKTIQPSPVNILDKSSIF